MNIKKIDQSGMVRVLKTDKEVIVDVMTAADRVLVLKAKAKAAAVLATPEMIDIITELARTSKSEKIKLDAAKSIAAYGLGLPDKEQVIPHQGYNKNMPNEEIDAILSEDDSGKDV